MLLDKKSHLDGRVLTMVAFVVCLLAMMSHSIL
jgi:hypothetical protein